LDDHAFDLHTAQAPAWERERAGIGGRETFEEEEETEGAEAEAGAEAGGEGVTAATLRWFLTMTEAAPWTSACT